MPRKFSWLLVLLCLIAPATFAVAVESAPPAAVEAASSRLLCSEQVRAQDTVWTVSTRQLGCPAESTAAAAELQILRYANEEAWQKSDLASLLDDGGAPRQLLVYVHGNREDWCTARERGLLAYRALVQAGTDTPPVRFVIWSWPSDQIHGPRRDVRTKAARSDVEGYYLALFLAELKPGERVGLFGFSFGARIITGASHLLGGGSLLGLQLPPDRVRSEHHMRAALLAAAVHDFWLLPGNVHGNCWASLDELLVLINGCDRALRLYPHLDRCSRPQALGYVGFSWPGQLGDDAARLLQQDVACDIGSQHHAVTYFQSATVMSAVHRCLLAPQAK